MLRWIWALAVGSLLGACGGYHPEAPGPEAIAAEVTDREPAQGSVRGFVDRHGAHAWLGLPFAAPPVGELRWRAPRPAQTWDERREALSFSESCVQIGSPLGGASPEETGKLIGSEDCLYLNVWAPPMDAAAAERAQLPVMFWIHGGGNTIGASDFYSGAQLAADQNVIVVTTQYRMGPFGWFRHPLLAGDGDDVDTSGNYGTLDLIAGLRWVRENVRAFGGDPGNVTVFGESAGGTNVMSLMLSPLAQGLFHRAISQSGGAYRTPVSTAQNYQDADQPGAPQSGAEMALTALVHVGVAVDRAAARAAVEAMTAEQLGDILRAVPATDFYRLYTTTPGSLGPANPRVIADDLVIRSDDAPAFLSGPEAPQVPLLLGTNRDEPRIFMVFNPEYVQRAFGLPLWPLDAGAYAARSTIGALSWKVRGVDDLAAAANDGGNDQVYAYRWDWDEEGQAIGLIDMSELVGAAHGLEIPFVFGYWDVGGQSPLLFNEANRAGREQLSARMRGYWAEFARTGDPGTGGGRGPRWPAWGEGVTLLLDTDSGKGIRPLAGRVTADDVISRIAELPDRTLGCALLQDNFDRADQDWYAAAHAQLGCAGLVESTGGR